MKKQKKRLEAEEKIKVETVEVEATIPMKSIAVRAILHSTLINNSMISYSICSALWKAIRYWIITFQLNV